jgi:hypothetical protein
VTEEERRLVVDMQKLQCCRENEGVCVGGGGGQELHFTAPAAAPAGAGIVPMPSSC